MPACSRKNSPREVPAAKKVCVEEKVNQTTKAVTPAPAGNWDEFPVEQWRSAMFNTKAFHAQLFEDTTDFVADLCQKTGKDTLLVEVGCGTGEALVPLWKHAKYSIGMDFNPHFIGYCNQQVPDDMKSNVKYFAGDAQELDACLHKEVGPWMEKCGPKILACVGNTAGIMPEEVKQNTYQQMKKLAGKDGYMVVIYWNGNQFGNACQHFYKKNPQLCGEFTGEHINLDTCTLKTPSGYCTHWTKPEEAIDIFENQIGAEVLHIKEMGTGVLVAGRAWGPSSKHMKWPK